MPNLGAVMSHVRVRRRGLVATRLVNRAGLAPLFDMINGAPTGEHNATIERTNLAASAEAPEQAPCIAALASRPMEPGEEVLLDYGAYTAGRFLYQYGWLPGGDATPAGATSPHDEPVLVLRRCRGRGHEHGHGGRSTCAGA